MICAARHSDLFKEDELGQAYARLREKSSASRILVRKPVGKRLLVRLRHGGKSSIEIISKKQGCIPCVVLIWLRI
jgi:hypothetical protein